MIMINVEEEIVETVIAIAIASTKVLPPPIGMDLDEIATEIVIEIVIGTIAEAISMDLLIEVIEVVIVEVGEVVQEQIGEPLGIKMSHEVAVEAEDTPVMSNLNG